MSEPVISRFRPPDGPIDCYARTCSRGLHLYHGLQHFDYCPDCFEEIPEWVKEIMRAREGSRTYGSTSGATR